MAAAKYGTCRSHCSLKLFDEVTGLIDGLPDGRFRVALSNDKQKGTLNII
jgi:hypothetical protein